MKRKEIVVDSFAGGGGASLGIAWATGRAPHVSINHDPASIAMHKANHPSSLHLLEDVWKLNPRAVLRDRRLRPRGSTKAAAVGLLWASPDCRHFSRAKGGKPVAKPVRSLAWVVCKWAAEVRPRVIILENVREFADWGPIVPAWRCRECNWRGTEGQAVLVRTRRRCPRCESRNLRETEDFIPDPSRKGLTFRRWVGRLRNLGYVVEWKNLNAADYGAPTTRRRLFVVARRDGLPIVWPEPTHAAPGADPVKRGDMPLFNVHLKPYRQAAECIDWGVPCPSIFERKRPLADKTLRRVALGLKRYVLENPTPYIVRTSQTGAGGKNCNDVAEPLTTVVTKQEHCVVVPSLIQTGYGEAPGQAPRVLDLGKPLGTVVQGQKHAVASAVLVPQYGNSIGSDPSAPLGSITAGGMGKQAIAMPMLSQYYGATSRADDRCQTVGEPVPVVTTENRHAIVAAMLAKFYGGHIGSKMDGPTGTITTIDHHGIVAAELLSFRGESNGLPLTAPMPTVTSGAGAARPAGAAHALGVAAAFLARCNHGEKQWHAVDGPAPTITTQGNKIGLVFAFLVKYFGTSNAASLMEPLHTATTKQRFGLVTVETVPGVFLPGVGVTLGGEIYVIADIGLRMLNPRELARAQGFPDTYLLTGTKSQQVARIGNSVCPIMAKTLVESNYVPSLLTV